MGKSLLKVECPLTTERQLCKDGGHLFTGERQLFRRAVSPIADSTGASGGNQGHGRQTRSAHLSQAALRNEIRRPRSHVLRGTTPQTAGNSSQAKSRPTRIANHRSCSSRLKHTLESLERFVVT